LEAAGAAQLLPALQVSTEWNRTVPSYQQSALFSFPPENWLTLLVPGLFGGDTGANYWGRWYWWEVTPYLGVTFLPLILLGFRHAPAGRRPMWLGGLAASALLMMGGYTPLFGLLYRFFPGFSLFRGYCKFEFEFALFACLFGAAGLDAVITNPRPRPRLALLSGVVATGLVGFALYLVSASGGDLPRAASLAFAARGEEYGPIPPLVNSLALAHGAAVQAGIAAALLGLTALLLAWPGQRRTASFGLATLIVLDMAGFANQRTETFDSGPKKLTQLANLLAEHPGDYRILQKTDPNSAMVLNQSDIWGYDPLRLRRYDELMEAAEGSETTQGMRDVRFHRYTPAMALFRCAVVFLPRPGGWNVEYHDDALPHALFVPGYEVVTGEDLARQAVLTASFDPRQSVVLESDPGLGPVDGTGTGAVVVKPINGDSFEVSAETDAAGLVLVTDSYSRFWKVKTLDGDTATYRVMPANCAQIAVPVGPGHHHFELYYLPSLYPVGSLISLLSLGFCGLVLIFPKSVEALFRLGPRRATQ